VLSKSKHKRPKHEHVVITPRLLTSRWQKSLNKVCDVIFPVPVGCDVCLFSQHELLIIGIAFPLIQHRPWRLRGSRLMAVPEWRLLLAGARIFCANYAYKREGWRPCQKAWCGPCYTGAELTRFPVLEPEDKDDVVTLISQDKHRFQVAKNGDHLMVAFQCNWCHFVNINKRNPIQDKPEDICLMRCIR